MVGKGEWNSVGLWLQRSQGSWHIVLRSYFYVCGV